MKSPTDVSNKHLDKSLSLSDRRFKLEKVLRQDARYLEEIAEACAMLGLHDLADNLCITAEHIQECAQESSDVYGEDLDNRVKETNQSTANMISACLAVACTTNPQT